MLHIQTLQTVNHPEAGLTQIFQNHQVACVIRAGEQTVWDGQRVSGVSDEAIKNRNQSTVGGNFVGKCFVATEKTATR